MMKTGRSVAYPAVAYKPFHLISEEQTCCHELSKDLQEVLKKERGKARIEW
jgi:hypothetical protein